MGHAASRILFLQQEWSRWKLSRHNNYTIHACSFQHGCRERGIESRVITPLWERGLATLCRQERFNQVWLLDTTHLLMDARVVESVCAPVPIRVGFVTESLEYTEEEMQLYPPLRHRKAEVLAKLKRWCTHAVVYDEADVETIQRGAGIPAVWSPVSVPRCFMRNSPPAPANSSASFGGAVYGERKSWLENPDFAGLLKRQVSREQKTLYPFLYDALDTVTRVIRKLGLLGLPLLPAYTACLRLAREHCQQLWMEGMISGSAVVNLPSFFKGYTARVTEAMAIGRAVISWRIPDRPRTCALFKEGEEILLFDKAKPEEFLRHLRRVREDGGFAADIARRAGAKLRALHTTEHRTGQILDWLKSGQNPEYSEKVEREPSPASSVSSS